MKTLRAFLPVALASLAGAIASGMSVADADTAAGRRPEGIWQGTLQGMLRIVIHIDRDSVGALTGTMDSPDQGATGLPIDTVAFAGDSLRFELRRIGGGYVGHMRAAGDSIAGQWRQGGMSLPLVLGRVDQVHELRRPQEPLRPYPYDTVAVAFDNPHAKAVRLAGTLTLPRRAGPFPCALLITGSGPEDRDETVFGHRPFLVLADHLTRQGIAVLRVDDRGVGGSTGRFSGATSEDFAGDVLAGIAFLKSRKEIDRKKIGLIGHSEGGLIAPIVASRSKDVAFVVLMAGPGLRGDSLLTLQAAALRRLAGASEESIARESAASRRLYALLRQGDSVGVVRATRELVGLQTQGATEAQIKALGDLDTLATRASRQFFAPWMRFFIDFDPRPTLMKVKCPVLALNGSKDFQVPPKENLAAIEAAFRDAGNRDFTAKELPGLNHLFQTAQTGSLAEYSKIEETIAPPALEEMSQWILRHTTEKR